MGTLTSFFGGGGGGLPPINSSVYLDKITDTATVGDAVFLRSGIIETNTSLYPDAEVKSLPDFGNVSYDSVSFSTSAQDNSPRDIAFNNDGTKMYMVGTVNDAVYEYNLSTAYDLSTASYASKSFSTAGQDGLPYSVAFSTDGTIMFVLGLTNSRIYKYTLSTAFDVTTASLADSIATIDNSATGIRFSPDGTLLFEVGVNGDRVTRRTLPGAYDISSSSYDQFVNIINETGNARGLAFNNAGTKMFIVTASGDIGLQYNLAKPFDLNSASYDGVVANFSPQGLTETEAVMFNGDFTKLYVLCLGTDAIYQYTMSPYIGNPILKRDGFLHQYVRVA